MNPLTQNMYTVKDSFDAANKINQILSNVQNSDEYVLVSLDVVSLFTNVPLKKTVDILKRIYTGKENCSYTYEKIFKEINFRNLSKNSFLF